jgi:transcriptional regulator with XRE-family HTH domain
MFFPWDDSSKEHCLIEVKHLLPGLATNHTSSVRASCDAPVMVGIRGRRIHCRGEHAPRSGSGGTAVTEGGPSEPWDTFGGYLRSQRKLAQLSIRQLADLTKVSNPYLSQIERGLHQPSIGVIKSLAQALNLSVGDLLAHAADIVTGDETDSTTESSIRRDPKLNDAQKQALLAVYASMVSNDPVRGDSTGTAVETDEADPPPPTP